VVGGEARAKPSTTAALEKQLLSHYPVFMATEPARLRRRANGELPEAACQDIAQEAFERVRGRIVAGRMDAPVNVPAYLGRTAWNLALDVLRAQRRSPVVHDTDLVTEIPVRRSSSMEVDPLEELVKPVIDAMPPTRRRDVVRLQSQGLEDAAIAEALDIPPERLHKDRHAAVRELRGKLRPNIRDGHRKQTRQVKKDG
jgi:RNA polymerase sigma-70 factor (ECF subfamily)